MLLQRSISDSRKLDPETIKSVFNHTVQGRSRLLKSGPAM